MQAQLGLAHCNVPTDPSQFTEELARSWSTLGIRCLATGFRLPHEEIGRLHAARLRALLSDHGMHVVQYAGVNANLVHASADVRGRGRQQVAAAARAAAALGATMLISGCGTNHPDFEKHFYGPDSRNYTAEAADRLVEELRLLAPVVEDAGIRYAIECHQLSTMRSPEVIREVLDRVDSPAVVANFDPVNLLDSPWAVLNNAERMQHMADVVGPRYGPSCHLKDVRLAPEFVCHIEEAVPGEGVLDMAAFFKAVSGLPQPVGVVIEHLGTIEQAAKAVEFTRAAAQVNGVELT